MESGIGRRHLRSPIGWVFFASREVRRMARRDCDVRAGAMSHESHASQTTQWVTPRWIFEWLGSFDLDPATFAGHPWPCATENRFERGLETPWRGRVFLNPPFTNGQIEPFMARMAEHRQGVCVVAARVETGWFQDHVFGAAEAIWFPRKRIQFCDASGVETTRCGFPACVAFYESPPHSTPRPGSWWLRERHIPVPIICLKETHREKVLQRAVVPLLRQPADDQVLARRQSVEADGGV